MKNNIRVVITGIGMVTPLGHNTQTTWQNLLAGKSGIQRIQNFDASGFPTQIAAEVRHFPENTSAKYRRLARYMVPSIHFALSACEEALQDAGIFPTATTRCRWGVVAGSSMMSTEFDFWRDFQENYAPTGELDVAKIAGGDSMPIAPSQFGKMQTNSGLAVLTHYFDIHGYAMAVHTACASGGQALGLGMQAIRRGDADYILAGGYDSMINPMSVGGFCLLGALSTYNDTPETASRPFDLTRNGFVLGEGAAFLVLENAETARARGATIYAELAGEGNSLSSYRITDSHPSGDGAIQAIQAALKDAKIKASDIDYINAHGTSTKMNDICETNALKAVFHQYAKQIPISSTKSLTGHLISAAGALEGAFSALAIHHCKIPMTANLQKPDPECDLDYVAEGPREKAIGAVLSNSFGFGGTNSCVVLKHPDFAGDH